MGHERITRNMSVMDVLEVMAEGNEGAFTVLLRMLEDPRSKQDILLLDALGIRGSRLWMLFSDCCGRHVGKFRRTILALCEGAYSEEEIHGNLGLCRALPFLDDSIQIEGVPSYDGDFGPLHKMWDEYIKANKEVCAPRIREGIEAEKDFARS